MGPKDPILGVTEAFLEDQDPKKLNLGVGAYRDDNGKPVVLECVRQAQQKIFESNMNNEYAPISGIKEFNVAAVKLAYGDDSPVVKEGRYAVMQSLSGTGALRLIGAFLARFKPMDVYLPTPTWGNHIPIFGDAGLQVKKYRYYDASTKGLDLKGLVDDLKAAPNGSCFLFHACAHNPTGVDPKPHEWAEISQAAKLKKHFLVVDSAYQGFASGDTNRDAISIRTFVADGHQIALCQSFSKNFGLYGQRIGALSLVTETPHEAQRVESQLKILARPIYSNPPIHGARIVSMILNDPVLHDLWKKEVKGMADRIILMRQMLVDGLKQAGSQHSWRHITDQIGMFCFSGMTPEQVNRLTSQYHIYLTSNGRISLAGLTSKHIPYLAQSIHEVTK
jgi:aspartate aminotransferase